MEAYGACCGRFLADDDVSAVTADPYGVTFAGEHDALFDVGEETAVALFVVALDGSYGAETVGDSRESWAIRSYIEVHS